ncbi:hypothetical protein LPB140_03000 [Sphingorhabdus lutea]|uniref:LPS export ABC transporter periplasmic protein LptC n=1 Tax=Sphingorhabdus lutea TaxID=1913578 RepID=A0A1L3JA14_9SPHN|nr:LPS export ABC transporter periplasmic protein LptC [Sphingorhabdus lutea]APG61964.1 hypothetical protein LPB140_03000 [Sphingorhabdus lutea]
MSIAADQQKSKRALFAQPGSSHDRIVGFLQVFLPLLVGALLAVLVFSPLANDREFSFVLDQKGVDVASERMRTSQALYRGKDAEGRPFLIEAGSAVQKSSGDSKINLEAMTGKAFIGKDQATIQAQRADYDIDQEYLQVNGPISLSTMSGYDMVVNNVTFFIKTQRMQSQGAVSGRTNIGTFSANRLNADLKARTITLSGNAQLRIDQNAIK